MQAVVLPQPAVVVVAVASDQQGLGQAPGDEYLHHVI